MPKKPIDYSKALIYSIVCKTDESLLYIGSTTNFTKRKNLHKTACYNEKNVNYNVPVYVMIRANGGWDNFEMNPVKEFPCENKIQLVIEEERIRKEMNANLNTKRAYRTEEEKQEQKQEQKKKWAEKNKEEIKEYVKEYKEEHKEEIKEQSKKYRESHKEDIKKYHQKRYLENKEKINEKRRERYLAKKNNISD